MDTEEFRAALVELDLSQGALARLFKHLGDTADRLTIRRRVERWAQGGSNIPGEAAAFLNLLKQFPPVLALLKQMVAPAPGPGRPRRPVETKEDG